MDKIEKNEDKEEKESNEVNKVDNENKENNKEINCNRYLLYAVIAFITFGLEYVITIIEKNCIGESVNKTFHYVVMSIIWAIVVSVLIKISKKRLNFDILKLSYNKIDGKVLVTAIILTTLSGVSFILTKGNFKVYSYYKDLEFIEFIAKYICCFFEAEIMLLEIVFAQKFFEEKYKTNQFIFGGLFLACTWGLIMFITNGLLAGITTFITALIFGVIYMVLNKNIKYVYPLLLLLYII